MKQQDIQTTKKDGGGWRKWATWGAVIVAFVIGRTAPGAVILPGLGYYGSHLSLKKFGDPLKADLFFTISTLVAHSWWIICALVMMQQVNMSLLYALIGVISAVLLYKIPTAKIVYSVAILNGLIGLDYVTGLLSQQTAVTLAAYSVHVFLSFAAVLTLVIAFRRRQARR